MAPVQLNTEAISLMTSRPFLESSLVSFLEWGISERTSSTKCRCWLVTPREDSTSTLFLFLYLGIPGSDDEEEGAACLLFLEPFSTPDEDDEEAEAAEDASGSMPSTILSCILVASLINCFLLDGMIESRESIYGCEREKENDTILSLSKIPICKRRCKTNAHMICPCKMLLRRNTSAASFFF